jgi:hypothetical protein
MAQKGSKFRAEANPAPARRAHCKSILTEVGRAHPLDASDRNVWRGAGPRQENGSPKVFPMCHECYQAGWH